MATRQRNILVDDDLIQKHIPQIKRIKNRLVYTDSLGTPIRTKSGLYLLSWKTTVYAERQRLTPMRAMTEAEVLAIAKSMTGTYAIRDRAWFILATYCGLRPAQLLTLTVEDVFDYGGIKATFTIPLLRRRTPDRQEKDMHPAAGEALIRWVKVLQHVYPHLPGDFPLFKSRKSDKFGSRKNPSRQQFWHIIQQACKVAHVERVTEDGRLCAESMYKTYLSWAHEANGWDILAIAKLAGHKQINTTVRALQLDLQTPDQRFNDSHRHEKKQ